MSSIAVEGIIGVGKSVLCSKVSAYYAQQLVPVPHLVLQETVHDKLLQLFYTQTEKHAFGFQLFMVSTRIAQAQTAQLERKNSVVFCDRCPLGDAVFAHVNCLRGMITLDEFEAYCDILGSVSTSSCIEQVWYLWDYPAECQRRVQQSRSGEETKIPLQYFVTLDNVYFVNMMRLAAGGKQVLSLLMPRGEYNDVAQLLTATKTAMRPQFLDPAKCAAFVRDELPQYAVANTPVWYYDIPDAVKLATLTHSRCQ